MKLIFVLLFVLVQSIAMSGQTTLSGSVTDVNNTPIPNANILLFSIPDSSFHSGTITNEYGNYEVSLREDFNGFIRIRCLGYESMDILVNETKLVYYIQLKTAVVEMDEITVKAQKPVFEKKADRLVINIESNISSLGGNSLELLEKSPGVFVNRANEVISLNGKQGVMVMIDDKIQRLPAEALMNLLNSISVNEVEKIELITNPSTRYDASGSGGIIHLIMNRKDTDGWSGQVGGSAEFYHKPGGAINGSLTWNKGKFNSFASYSVSLDRRKEKWIQNIRTPLSDYDFFTDSRIIRHADTWLHNITFGINYQINQGTTFETLITGYRRNYTQTGYNTGIFQKEPNVDQSFQSDLYEDNIRNMGTFFTGLTHAFSDRRQLVISLEYIGNKQDQPSSYTNSFEMGDTEILEATKSTPLNVWIGKVDYGWKFLNDFELSAGVQYSLSRFDNDVEILTRRGSKIERDEELSLLSELDEKIFSAYISSEWQVRDNWKLRAGLRLENAQTELIENQLTAIVNRDDIHFFPELISEVTISDRSRLSLSYGRRIVRPSFLDLAPFVFYPNPVTLFYGNPALLPGVSHNIDLNYSFGELWFTLGLATTKDKIVPFQPNFHREERMMVYKPQNLNQSHDFRLQVGFPIRPAKWLDYNNTIALRTTRFRVDAADETMSIPGLDYQGNLSIFLPHDFSIGLDGLLFVNTSWGIGSLKPYGKLDIGLRKKFPYVNGTLGITYSDALDTYMWYYRVHDEKTAGFEADLDFNYGMRGVRVSYSMSLGNKEVNKKNIDTGSKDVKGRIN